MTSIKNIFKSKSYPSFIKDSPVFSQIKTVNKSFAEIGLNNFEKEFAHTIQVDKIIFGIIDFIINECRYFQYLPNMTEIGNFFTKNRKSFVENYNKTGKLVLPENFSCALLNGKEGESLFKFYNRIRATGNFLHLESCQSFKDFSALNGAQKGKFKIVFSADGEEGIWDIATMSMRGIASCQSWTGQYKKCLIGSILDPHTGIIYLTSGSKNKYGTKMLKRCIVRLLADKDGNKTILLDKMYPSGDPNIRDGFVQAIKEKLNDPNISVLNEYPPPVSLCIPYAPYIYKYLTANGHSVKSISRVNDNGGYFNKLHLSYRDTFVPFDLSPITNIEINTFRENLKKSIKKKIIGKFKFTDETITDKVLQTLDSNELNTIKLLKKEVKKKLGAAKPFLDSWYNSRSKEWVKIANVNPTGKKALKDKSIKLKYIETITKVISEL